MKIYGFLLLLIGLFLLPACQPAKEAYTLTIDQIKAEQAEMKGEATGSSGEDDFEGPFKRGMTYEGSPGDGLKIESLGFSSGGKAGHIHKAWTYENAKGETVIYVRSFPFEG